MERNAKVETEPTLDREKRIEPEGDDGSDFVQVPMIELRLQAGVPGFQADPEYNDGEKLSLPRTWLEQKRLNAESLVALKVRGDSMYPTLTENDTVIINTADRNMVDSKIFAVNYQGRAMIKRLQFEGGTWYLSSDNNQPEHSRRPVRDSETMIVGRMVRSERDWS